MLLISTCADPLHELEFVAPITRLVAAAGHTTETVRLGDLTQEQVAAADAIIICGTSLKDDAYLATDPSWLRDVRVPVLGICAGMQLIGLAYGGALIDNTEIGFSKECFTDFLGLDGEQEIYRLHGHAIDFAALSDFDIRSGGAVAQAVQHRSKPLYGVLFHPEVRRHDLIARFCSLAQKQ